MKRLPSWLIGSGTGLRQPDTSEAYEARLRLRVNSIQKSDGRRLSDRIAIVFEEACLAGDPDTAELLLTAFEQQWRDENDRRVCDPLINRLREKLARCKTSPTRRRRDVGVGAEAGELQVAEEQAHSL